MRKDKTRSSPTPTPDRRRHSSEWILLLQQPLLFCSFSHRAGVWPVDHQQRSGNQSSTQCPGNLLQSSAVLPGVNSRTHNRHQAWQSIVGQLLYKISRQLKHLLFQVRPNNRKSRHCRRKGNFLVIISLKKPPITSCRVYSVTKYITLRMVSPLLL